MSSATNVQAGPVAMDPGPATVVITRVVRPGHEQDYRAWMGRLIAAAEVAPHSLGTVVLAPKLNESNTFRVIHRFADAASLRQWEDSDVRVQLSAEADRFSSSQRQEVTGQEAWFSIPEEPAKSPKESAQPALIKWRMVIVTFFIAYAFTAVIIPRESAWLPKSWSFYESNVITNLLLALAMTYLIPLVTRLLRRWLY